MKGDRIREPDVNLLNIWRPGIPTDAVLIAIQPSGELVRMNPPGAMTSGTVVFDLIKNRAVRGGVVAMRTKSLLTVPMRTLGTGALFDVARNVMTLNFSGLLTSEHYVGYN